MRCGRERVGRLNVENGWVDERAGGWRIRIVIGPCRHMVQDLCWRWLSLAPAKLSELHWIWYSTSFFKGSMPEAARCWVKIVQSVRTSVPYQVPHARTRMETTGPCWPSWWIPFTSPAVPFAVLVICWRERMMRCFEYPSVGQRTDAGSPIGRQWQGGGPGTISSSVLDSFGW
jgi:hypothetical protein